MTIEDIKKLIAGDETRTLELKKTTGELKDAMHSVCAMLNSDGGASHHRYRTCLGEDSRADSDRFYQTRDCSRDSQIGAVCQYDC